jgi:hypothetical protein
LDYLPPINFSFRYHHVLPMYPSSTLPWPIKEKVIG